MKEQELRAAAICAVCHNRIGAAKVPLFYRVRIERFMVRLDAVQRQTGLEMVLGGCVPIARALSPDEEMASPVMDPITLTVCETCGIRPVEVAALIESASLVESLIRADSPEEEIDHEG
jgi:hypothetical protein